MTKPVPLLNKWKVGADPEFVVVGHGDRPLPLNQYVADNKAPFGFDHGARVAELHPEPKRSTYNLVRGIKRILDSAPEPIKGFRWKAGAVWGWDDDPRIGAAGQEVVGGHIHFDMPYPRGGWAQTDEYQTRLTALDKYTRLLESLDILPKSESSRRRQTTQYGKFGAYRLGPVDNHLEYRTMASWLIHPATAMICLTGAKVCAQFPKECTEYLSQPINSRARLRGLFDQVNVADTDVTRIKDKLNLLEFTADADTDMRESWKELAF